MVDNLARHSAGKPAPKSTPMDVESLVANPAFPAAEALVAARLIALQGASPKLPRLKSNHRKWLITQSLYAIASQRDPAEPLSGLTASRLIDTVIEIGAASRNTASAFLLEMLTYKFLREVPDVPDKRVRILELTDISILGMRTWFEAHMQALDTLDGGTRVAVSAAEPALFPLAQRHAARALVESPAWRNPPDSIAGFAWSDAGGMILHHLMTMIPEGHREGGRVMIGQVVLSDLAERYTISVSNVKRMFSRVEKEELAGWTQQRRRGTFWMSEAMVGDYLRWEAEKLAALDAAFHHACQTLAIPYPA